jgi:hypothetical protein
VKEASDTMLVAATGYADAFWRQSAWYLNILVDLQPKPGLAKMEKMDKFHVRMEKFPVKWRKLFNVPGRIGAATSRQYIVAFHQDTRNVHYVARSVLQCDFGVEKAEE